MYLELIRMRLEHQYYRTVDVRYTKPRFESSFLEPRAPQTRH